MFICNYPGKLLTVIEPEFVIEGAGVLLRRFIAPRVSNEFDPFLLFDHFAFNDPIVGPLLGFPMYPHRGIEPMTYMFEGLDHPPRAASATATDRPG